MPIEKVCRACKNAHRTNELNQFECRRYPPSMFLVPVQTLEGQGAGFQSVYTIVMGEAWCGEWMGKVSLVEGE